MITVNSGIPLDKSVSVLSPVPIIEAQTVLLWSTTSRVM